MKVSVAKAVRLHAEVCVVTDALHLALQDADKHVLLIVLQGVPHRVLIHVKGHVCQLALTHVRGLRNMRIQTR